MAQLEAAVLELGQWPVGRFGRAAMRPGRSGGVEFPHGGAEFEHEFGDCVGGLPVELRREGDLRIPTTRRDIGRSPLRKVSSQELVRLLEAKVGLDIIAGARIITPLGLRMEECVSGLGRAGVAQSAERLICNQ